MRKNFWRHKRVLITGASGFIGTHLAQFLRKKGARVIGLGKRGNTESVDITEYDSLLEIFKKNQFDVCYHLAATALVEAGQKTPYATLKNNLLSTLNILELCRLHAVKKIIITSTAHVYGAGEELFHEEHAPRPSRPYETSKTCADIIAQSYADTFRLPVLIPRFVNIYGPGDLNLTRVVPKTIQRVLAKKNPLLWGGSSMREYLYIGDVLHAFDLLAQISEKQMEKNRIYNFGTGEPISTRDLLKEIVTLAKENLKITMTHGGRKDEIEKQSVSWDKAKRVLGWKPKTQLQKGLLLTIDWHRKHGTMQSDL